MLVDLSGNGRNGAMRGFETNKWSADKSICFDGRDDRVDLGLAGYNFGNEQTMIIRGKFIHKSGIQDAFGNWDNAGGGFGITSTEVMSNVSKNGSYRSVFARPASDYNTYAMVTDSNTVKIYQNGELVDMINISGPIKVCSLPFLLGANPEYAGGYVRATEFYFKSAMIYNIALTAAEVMQNYRAYMQLFNGAPNAVQCVTISQALGWTNQPVTLNIDDSQTNVTYEYKFDGKADSAYRALAAGRTVTPEQSGEGYIWVRAVDESGTAGPGTRSENQYRWDGQSPVIQNAFLSIVNPNYEMADTVWRSAAYKLTCNAADAVSGIASLKYKYGYEDDSKFKDIPSSLYPASGSWTFVVRAYDNAGNYSDYECAPIYCDRTAPVVRTARILSADTTSQTLTVSLNIMELHSGLRSVEYSFDNIVYHTLPSAGTYNNQDAEVTCKMFRTPQAKAIMCGSGSYGYDVFNGHRGVVVVKHICDELIKQSWTVEPKPQLAPVDSGLGSCTASDSHTQTAPCHIAVPQAGGCVGNTTVYFRPLPIL